MTIIINTIDKPMILEKDNLKLNKAVHIALKEACDCLKKYYLPEYDEVPGLECYLGKDSKNSSQVAIQILNPTKIKSGIEYIEAADTILDISGRKKLKKDELFKVSNAKPVICSKDKIKLRRWRNSHHHMAKIRMGLRLFMMSLLRQKKILLPPNLMKYIPVGKGSIIIGAKLMPEKLRDICSLHYNGISPSVDWNRFEYISYHQGKQVEGVEKISRSGRNNLIQFTMSNTLSDLREVTKENISKMRSFTSLGTIGQFLTYLYLKRNKKENYFEEFEVIRSTPHLKIYVPEYEVWRGNIKTRKYRKRLRKNKSKIDKENTPKDYKRKFRKFIAKIVSKSIKHGNIDGEVLARKIKSFEDKPQVQSISNWATNEILPKEIQFNVEKRTREWKNIINYYFGIKKYEKGTLKNWRYNLQPFIFYLTIYLPLYFHFNKSSDAKYPERLDELVGAHFISRYIDVPDKNYPMPYIEFLNAWYEDQFDDRVYSSIRALHQIFDEILRRKELFGLNAQFMNPVMQSDIPSSGPRKWETNKGIFTTEIFWICLITLYKYMNYIDVINSMLMENPGRRLEYLSIVNSQPSKQLVKIKDIKKQFNLKIDCKIKFNGKTREVKMIPKLFISPQELKLKGYGRTMVIPPNRLVHLITALETGLRHQSIQWLDCDFDCYLKGAEIQDDGIDYLRVNTDKAKSTPWKAVVSGRVINILRKQKDFREQLENKIFKRKIPYEGDLNSKWGKILPLFALDEETGRQHSNSVYELAWRKLLVSLQLVLDEYGIELLLKKEIETETTSNVAKYPTLEDGSKLTPHSTRASVVNERLTFLPEEYVGKYITGQTVATVGFYRKSDAEKLRKLTKMHKKHLNQLKKDNYEVSVELDPVCIDATEKNKTLHEAFSTDPKQAIVDYGALCSHHWEKEDGFDILLNKANVKIAFEFTHICPFGNLCPYERRKIGYEYRCNFCDYAIRTVDHLPGIACEYRRLVDRLEYYENTITENKTKLAKGQFKRVDKKIRAITEDLVSLRHAMIVLDESLKSLKQDRKQNPKYYLHCPEAVREELESVPLPDRTYYIKYLIYRLKELNAYPSHHDLATKMKVDRLYRTIQARSGMLKDTILLNDDIEDNVAQAYSMVKSLMNVNKWTVNDIVKIAEKPLTDFVKIDYQSDNLIGSQIIQPSEIKMLEKVA